MECLPDELLLLIFRHLHELDIICAFHSLNRRFQQITDPYLYNIDLTKENNVSYKTVYVFINDILPSHGHKIRSLTLGRGQQRRLFQPYIHQLTNLEFLTLKSDGTSKSNYIYELHQFLTQVLSLRTLNELSIPEGRKTLKTIAFSASHNLTALTLLGSNGLPYLNCVSHMPFIRRFTVDLISSKTFVKLHLEFEEDIHASQWNWKSSFEPIKLFLDIFKNNLKSLTLIGITRSKEFSNFDQFQSLVNSFTRIQTFQYHISTNHQPDCRFSNIKKLLDCNYCFGTLPQPDTLKIKSGLTKLEFSLWPKRTPQQLLMCSILYVTRNEYLPTALLSFFESKNDIRLVNLKKVDFLHAIEDVTPTTLELLSKLITLSPNIQTLSVYISKTEKTIEHLKELFSNGPQRILNVECNSHWTTDDSYHSTFFYELSKIFPKLQTLTFPCVQKFIDQYPMTLADLIRNLRKDFLRLTSFKLRMIKYDETCQRNFDSYMSNFDDSIQQNPLYYTVERGKRKYFLNIWL